MKESAADIVKYLDIIDENTSAENLQEETEIHLGINTQGVDVGQRYFYDNGIRWIRILEDIDDAWLIEHGLIEHNAEDSMHISKQDISTMIKNGEMILEEIKEEDILTESLFNEDEFSEFMERVDRYLLVNYMVESKDCNYAWKVAWAEGKLPSEACDEAIILED